MRLLGRKRRDTSTWDASAATEFWDWWATARDDVAAAIAEGTVTSFVDEINARIDALHSGLAWEFNKGSTSEHVFVISAEGVAEMRAFAERLVRAAPPADATWQYASTRQRDPDADTARLQLGDVLVEVGHTRFVTAYDEDRVELDVFVHNPAFTQLGGAARQALYLIMDWTLGEDAVERWVGRIEIAPMPPDENESLTIAGLREAVETLATTTEPFWVLMRAEGEDLLVAARRPLKRAAYPLFDLRVDVTVALRSSDLGPAQTLDEDVVRLLGADGMHAASVTEGRQRTSLFYCDAERVTVSELEAAVKASAPDERVEVQAELDPGWTAVRDYR